MLWYWALRVWSVNDDFIAGAAGTSRGGLSRQHDVGALVPGGPGEAPAFGPAPLGVSVLWKRCAYDSRSWGLEKCEEKLFLFIFCSDYPVFVIWSFYSFLCFFCTHKMSYVRVQKSTSLNASIHVFMAKHFWRILVKKSLTRVFCTKGEEEESWHLMQAGKEWS